MPRYLPRPKGSLGPAPALSPPLVVTLRCVENFNVEGVGFRKGDVVDPHDPLVQRISEEYPWFFRAEST
jgi:hypothetical protein